MMLELPWLDRQAVAAIAEPVMSAEIDAVVDRTDRAITQGHVQGTGVRAAATVPV